jgi:outer membrane protein W
MRVFVALLLLAIPVAAQERANRIGLFLSQPTFDSTGAEGDGFGLSYERHFTERWSAELAVSREQYTDTGIFPGTAEFEVEAYPIDATVRFTFETPSRHWRPFMGAGARFVDPSDNPRLEVDNRLSAQIVGGVDFQFGERWYLRGDVKALLRLNSEPYDSVLKLSLGGGLRF